MSKPKTNLRDLTNKQLFGRLQSAEQRVYALKDELNRRERIVFYGSEAPELREFNVAVTADFWTTIQAKDETDAIRVLEEIGWLEWYDTHPGGAVVVLNSEIEYEEPVPVEEIEAMRADAAERLKKIEASMKTVGADGIANSIH